MTDAIGLTMIDDVDGKSTGIAFDGDANAYVALTLTESRYFATLGDATRWLATKGYAADGSKLDRCPPTLRTGEVP